MNSDSEASIQETHIFNTNISAEQHRQLLYELGCGRKISAIKLVGQMSGLGLIDSKDYVEDELATELESLTPEQLDSLGLGDM